MKSHFGRSIGLIYLFEFLKNLQFFGPVAIFFYLDWAKIDYTRMFLLEATFVLFMFLLDVPTGLIADRFGRKWSLVLGGVISGISFAIFGLLNSYPVFFFANFMCALGFALLSGADRALLFDTLKTAGRDGEARHFFTRSEAFSTAGMLVAFPLGSLFAGSTILPYPQGLPLTFLISGISFALAGAAACFIPEPPRAEKVGKPLKEGVEGFLFLFRHPGMRLYSFNFAMVSASTFFVYWFYQTLCRAGGLPVGANGFVGAGFNLAGMVLLWNAAKLEKIVGLKRLLFVSAILPGALYIGLGFTMSPWFSLPAVFFIAGMKQLRAPLLSDLMNRLTDSRNRATVLSGVSMLERGIMFLFYPLVGLIADRSLSCLFFFLGGVTVLFAVLSRIPSGYALEEKKNPSDAENPFR